MDALDDLRTELIAAVEGAPTIDALDQLRVSALGKKGRITAQLKALAGLDADTRRVAGQALNRLKDDVALAIDARRRVLARADLDRRLIAERIDITLSPRPEPAGRIHPISQTIDEVVAILGAMGFVVAEGPDIEDDWHNFTALNIPPEHPARQEMDTFYLSGRRDDHRLLLRTHTSPVQIRALRTTPPPLRIIAPGRTYRSDSDATHSPMFHQVEGLIVDDRTNMGHLKGCLIDFLRAYFGIDNLPVRVRPSYFPFTEPSAEIDIGCRRSGGQLIIGAGDDWLEILGCGMVNPAVLTAAGIDPDRYQGFAFGMGLERIAMLKYGIPDLRTFFESDLRWLRHYGFAPVIVPDASGAAAP